MALRSLAASSALSGLRLKFGSCATAAPGVSLKAAFARRFATVRDDCKYAESHEYALIKDDVATLGISDFAQAELGDVVYVELPEVGSTLNKGKTFGVVESVKAASDIYAPLSGEVIEVNAALSGEPGLVNSEPYEGGWIAKIKLSKAGEEAELKDAAAYREHCESAGH